MGLFYTTFVADTNKEVLHLIVALGYPLGFIFVILGRIKLFTEETAFAVRPVLRAAVSGSEPLRLWTIIFLGNFVGCFLFALFISWLGPARELIAREAFVEFADALIKPGWYVILGSAVIAGWMMGLPRWLITSAQ